MKGLGAVVAAWLLLGALVALRTPAWAAPDEPAHYNVVAGLVANGRLPVLEAGDYDHARLTAAVAAGFPEGPGQGFLHYEDHQPPLYYLLLAPLYLATRGSLTALRLAGVALGAATAVCSWLAARTLLPERPRVALVAAAFVALLPQHLAVAASVNNDALLIPAVALGLLLAIRGRLAALAVVTGLAVLTKVTALPLLIVTAVVLVARRRAALLAVVVALVSPLLLRNAWLYGASDPLALARHAAVVVGEPTTAAWIATHGLPAWARYAAISAFRSFWAQFGWMSVVLDFRIYLAAAIVSVGVGVGFVADLRASPARRGAGLLALHALLVGLLFVGYNLEFVQPQGRYLFPALLPVAFGFARGLERLADPPVARRGAGVFGAGAVVLLGLGLSVGDMPGWTLLFVGAAALALLGLSRFPRSGSIPG